MKIHIQKNYLWFPIKNNAPKHTIEIFHIDEKLFEFEAEIVKNDFDFYAYLDVSKHIGSVLNVSGDFSEAFEDMIRNEDEKPQSRNHSLKYREDDRPLIHFTADIGWINDPNGLVYHDNTYHMFFQHNPFGVKWDNMTWGHATSTDLMHWTQHESALYPDEHGVMYSGCGLIDEKNLLGEGNDALLFYYTSTSGHNRWAMDKTTTQRLAISTDHGVTLQKDYRFVMEEMAVENRDPKVFYHKPSSAYVMALYLEENDFVIFRSTDLLHWEETQRLTLDKAWECPDLFELPIDGDVENTKWIFWSADGFYWVGSFDGYAFSPESERLSAYATRLPYAAQTYSGIQNRVISQSWLRATNRHNVHTGVMAIPAELNLVSTEAGLRLTLNPIEEFTQRRDAHYHMENVCRTPAIRLPKQAAEIVASFPKIATGVTTIQLSGHDLILDFDKKTLRYSHDVVPFTNEDGLDLRIFLDYEVIEIFANQGRCYMACENKSSSLNDYIQLSSEQEISSVDVYTLQ